MKSFKEAKETPASPIHHTTVYMILTLRFFILLPAKPPRPNLKNAYLLSSETYAREL